MCIDFGMVYFHFIQCIFYFSIPCFIPISCRSRTKFARMLRVLPCFLTSQWMAMRKLISRASGNSGFSFMMPWVLVLFFFLYFFLISFNFFFSFFGGIAIKFSQQLTLLFNEHSDGFLWTKLGLLHRGDEFWEWKMGKKSERMAFIYFSV